MPIDIATLIAPLTDDDPCGEDLEYAGISALEELATRKPEKQVGSQIIPAEEPDWNEVCRQAKTLFESTRDLRVAVRLAIGLLNTAAWEGFTAGLQVVQALLSNYWEGLHPRLDPADQFNPTVRLSVIGALAEASTVLRAVRLLPLARSRRLGRASFRDVLIAKGEIKPREDEQALDVATIDSIFRDADLAELTSTQEQVEAVLKSTELIDELLEEKNADRVLEPLIALLRDIKRVFVERIGARPMPAPVGAPEAGSKAEPAGPPVPGFRAGELATRADAIAAIERVIQYFSRHEPSSPLPILLTRARNLIGKDFMAIVNDLVPAGREQLDVLRGITQDEGSEQAKDE